jgi:Na+/proline symporter
VRPTDWLVLVGTVAAIVVYGLYRERGKRSAESYLRGGNDLKWATIGLSVMATQASAITFLSMPGQAYEDGMGFVQFYFGLPVAMVLLSAVALPIYHRLKLYTAYEYLETRFDRKTRVLVAILFLVSRGLASGMSIYAPAIVLSTVLGWPLGWTNAIIGGVVVLYTVSGGSRVVSRTQTLQMVVMLGGMAAAAVVIARQLPPSVSMGDAVHVAGALGKMQLVDWSPRLDTRYTFWSGMTGGLFVALAYFGTDQSQVQRYLGGASLSESRMGLLFNGLVKVPMQALILFVGVLVLVYYQFHQPPVLFHTGEWERALAGARAAEARAVDDDWTRAFEARRARAEALVAARARGDDAEAIARAKAALREADRAAQGIRARARTLAARPGAEAKDADYVFIRFVVSHFPTGLVGLLLAVILCAAMSATAAALSSLGTTTVVDLYRPWRARAGRPPPTDAESLRAARLFTVGWGALAVLFAATASLVDNLIQAVNILGSIFYGPMLGVFLVGFFVKRVGGTAAFAGVVVAQAIVVATFALSGIGFLWYNVIGCAAVIVVALAVSAVARGPGRSAAAG